MSLNKIKDLLQTRIGLNPISVGDSSIKLAVSHRLETLSITTRKEYYKLLLNDANEIYELIEEVVVPETWFFRNTSPFAALTEYIKNEIIPGLKKDEVIRILSIPCSTGEEPYSIAMALLDAKIDHRIIKIDAVDVSKRALTKAKRAIYGKNSFRDATVDDLKQYFTKVRSGHHLKEKIRNIVNFKQGNFLVGSLSPHPGYYDVIFCRNLLIYFDREIQAVAFEKLYRSLKETGVLFVGHAETGNITRSEFKKYDYPQSFAYVKKNKSPTSVQSKQPKATKNIDIVPKNVPKEWEDVFSQISQIHPFNKEQKQSVNKKLVRTNKNKHKVKKKKTTISLIVVEKLANEAKYEKALALCEEFLQANPGSAQGYYLKGMIAHSMGDYKIANSMLKKSIYLDPNQEQAMLLSMLLAQERGDDDTVKSFKRRIKRVQGRMKEGR